MFQGVTFKVEGGDLIIARILHGGMVDQQGLLHVGDIIKEVTFTGCTWLPSHFSTRWIVSSISQQYFICIKYCIKYHDCPSDTAYLRHTYKHHIFSQ